MTVAFEPVHQHIHCADDNMMRKAARYFSLPKCALVATGKIEITFAGTEQSRFPSKTRRNRCVLQIRQ